MSEFDDNLKSKILTELGENYLKLGKLKDAETNFNKALKLDSKNSRAYTGIGLILLKNQNYKKAIEFFNKALKFNEDNLEALSGLGEAKFYRGDKKEALDYIIKALDRDINNVKLLALLEKITLEKNQPEILEKYLKKFYNIHSNDANVIYSLAGLCYLQDRLEDAIAYLELIENSNLEYEKAKELKNIILKKQNIVNEMQEN